MLTFSTDARSSFRPAFTDGSAATEFYLYDAAGEKVVAEVENIGPGLTRNLEVSVKAGTYTSG